MDDGLILCFTCHKFFDQKTGEVPDKFKNVKVVEVYKKEYCKKCALGDPVMSRG